MAKHVTREQAERKRQQAVTLMERIGDSDRADEFDGMSVDEYAHHRGLQIANPRRKESRIWQRKPNCRNSWTTSTRC